MKKIYTILLIFAAIVVTKSQTFQWARQYGSAGLDGGFGITCNSGFAYTTGFFSGTTTFSATVPITVTAVNEDVYFAKIDSLGNTAWVQKFVSDQYERGTCITTDPSGNVLAAGFFHGTISCPVATLVGVGTSNFDIFITKLDNNGNFIWAKHLGNSVAQEAYTIKTDASGNVYVGGRFQGTLDFDPGASTYTLAASGSSYDGFLMKLDPSGNFLWAVNAFSSTNDDGISAVAIAASGNPYVTGHYYSGAQKMYVQQLNSSTGAYVWGSLLGASTHTSYGTCLQFDSSNNLIVGGYFRGTADFDFSSSSYPLTSSGADDAFIMKFSAAGTFSWAVRFGSSNGDRLFSLAVDPANNVWATGYFNNTVDFDPGTGSYPLAAATSTAPDVFLTGLTSNSNFIWAGKFGGTIDDVGNSIAVDGYKKIYTTGIFKMTADFDPSANSYSLTSNNLGNSYVQQMSQCVSAPSLTSAISGSNSICQNSTAGYSITPVNGANYYTWTLPSGWTGSSTGTNISTIANNNSGIITVNASNLCGTSTTQSLSVTIDQPTIMVSTSQNTICSGSSATLTASGASTYSWNTGLTTPVIVISPTTSTQYTVTGISSGGCQSNTIILQYVSPCTGINELINVQLVSVKPNPFTDKIMISVDGYTGKSVLIFNTLGQLIYSSVLHERETEIDLRELEKGVYIIRIDRYSATILKD